MEFPHDQENNQKYPSYEKGKSLLLPENSHQKQIKTGIPKRSFSQSYNGLTNQLMNLGKFYYDKELKYIGDMWNILVDKLLIFKDYCSKVGLCEDQFHNALSIMLKGRANLYHYQNLANKNFTFDEIISGLKSHF